MRRHDESRGAEAALHRTGHDEGLLDLRSVEPLDGDDLPAVRLAAKHEAGAHQRAVEIDRTRSAFPLLAGVLRTEERETLAQEVEKAFALPNVVGHMGCAIHGGADSHAANR